MPACVRGGSPGNMLESSEPYHFWSQAASARSPCRTTATSQSEDSAPPPEGESGTASSRPGAGVPSGTLGIVAPSTGAESVRGLAGAPAMPTGAHSPSSLASCRSRASCRASCRRASSRASSLYAAEIRCLICKLFWDVQANPCTMARHRLRKSRQWPTASMALTHITHSGCTLVFLIRFPSRVFGPGRWRSRTIGGRAASTFNEGWAPARNRIVAAVARTVALSLNRRARNEGGPLMLYCILKSSSISAVRPPMGISALAARTRSQITGLLRDLHLARATVRARIRTLQVARSYQSVSSPPSSLDQYLQARNSSTPHVHQLIRQRP
mmetsp:Transcript_97057/g.270064  ORF Transcript_97057/g.270064 Transcript_97057/m.270064 type:complete len:327 (-) Transcript_97057:28-1008(-)